MGKTITYGKQLMFRRGLSTGMPIMIGYLPIALAYGILARHAGLSLFELTLMSGLVYAGASQFMGTNMLILGASATEIVIATFVLNFRHFIMSLSFMNQLNHFKIHQKLTLSLGLTDESFAVSALHKEEAEKEHSLYFYMGLFLLAYFSWVLGSLLGGVLGEIIPHKLSQSMGIALYAMFIGLLIPSIKKKLRVGAIAFIAILLNLLLNQYMSEGWAIVWSTVIGGFSGIYFLKEEEV